MHEHIEYVEIMTASMQPGAISIIIYSGVLNMDNNTFQRMYVDNSSYLHVIRGDVKNSPQ